MPVQQMPVLEMRTLECAANVPISFLYFSHLKVQRQISHNITILPSNFPSSRKSLREYISAQALCTSGKQRQYRGSQEIAIEQFQRTNQLANYTKFLYEYF